MSVRRIPPEPNGVRELNRHDGRHGKKVEGLCVVCGVALEKD